MDKNVYTRSHFLNNWNSKTNSQQNMRASLMHQQTFSQTEMQNISQQFSFTSVIRNVVILYGTDNLIGSDVVFRLKNDYAKGSMLVVKHRIQDGFLIILNLYECKIGNNGNRYSRCNGIECYL